MQYSIDILDLVHYNKIIVIHEVEKIKGVVKMTRVQELIKKYHLETARQDGVEGLKFGRYPSAEEMENEVVEIKALKKEIMEEIYRQFCEEEEKELLKEQEATRKFLEKDAERVARYQATHPKKVKKAIENIKEFEEATHAYLEASAQ